MNRTCSTAHRYRSVVLVTLMAGTLWACGDINTKNFAEGIRVMTGKGGTHQERDVMGELAPIARDMATYSPKPAWSSTLHADAADIIEELPGRGILLGTVQLSSALSEPSFGSLFLYGADGKPVWESPRKSVPGGSYHLLLGEPVILLQATGRDALHLQALDPQTGTGRWESAIPQPATTTVHFATASIITASRGKKGGEIKALRISDGSELWRQVLPAGKEGSAAPTLLLDGNDILVVTDRLLRIAAANGQLLWETDNPAAGAKAEILAVKSGLVLWSGERAWLVDPRSGKVRWGPLQQAGVIQALTLIKPTDPIAYVLVRNTDGTSSGLHAVRLADGTILWRQPIKAKVESSLIPVGASLIYSTTGALEARAVDNGHLLFSTPLDNEFSSRVSEMPDLLLPRAGKVLLSREKSGIAAFDAKSGKPLWQHTMSIERMADFWYTTRASTFTQVTGIAAGHRKAAERERDWWAGYLHSWDRHWRSMDVGASSSLSSPGASTTSGWQATMGLTNALISLSAALEVELKQRAYDALAERLRLELENSLALHTRAFQGRYWIRPFKKRGTGVTVVDLESGKRADFEFASPNYGMEIYGLRLPAFVTADNGELTTVGVTLDPSQWERYVKFKWGLPYPAVQAFRLKDLRFGSHIRDDERLVNAAEKGDLASVRTLLANGAMADSRNMLGATALMLAAGGGHDPVVSLLLTKGASLRHRTGADAMSAAGLAAYQGHASTVLLLLKAGGDADEALRIATRHNKQNVVDAVLKAGYRMPITSLKDAVVFGDAAALRKFLDAGEGIESSLDIVGSTPLILAADMGQVEAARLLLERGAKINAQQSSGQKSSALMRAAENDRVAMVRFLLERGASVNARDGDGGNAVYHAVINKNTEVLNLLIKAGGEIDVATSIGKSTPLMRAAYLGNDAAVRTLLQAGASHAKRDKDGRTALSEAAYQGHNDVVAALLAAGAQVDAADNEGNTPLMRAAQWGRLAAVKALLKAGANINARNKAGKTALAGIKAFYFGSSVTPKEEMIRALEAAGAQ